MSLISHADVIAWRHRRGLSQENIAGIVGRHVAHIIAIEESGLPIDERLEEQFLMLGVVPGEGGPTALLTTSTTPVDLLQDDQKLTERAVQADDGVRRVSNSEIQTFKECRRKWWLGWHRGLALKQQPVVGPAMIGDRVHRAFQTMYDVGGPFYERGVSALEDVIDHDRQTVADLDEVTRKQFQDESDLERIMVEGYVQWVRETGADANLEVIASEQYVEARLQPFEHHGGLKIVGKLDVIVRQLSDGARRFIDHKTVGSIGQIMKRLRSNEQFKHYQLLHWLTTSDEERVGGVFVNMLRRVKRTARATPPFYAREEITHGRPAMEVYYDRLVAEIENVLQVEDQLRDDHRSHQEIVYPTFSQKCDWGCPFVNVCDMFDDGSRVEAAIEEQYEVVDPLSYYDRNKEGENTDG